MNFFFWISLIIFILSGFLSPCVFSLEDDAKPSHMAASSQKSFPDLISGAKEIDVWVNQLDLFMKEKEFPALNVKLAQFPIPAHFTVASLRVPFIEMKVFEDWHKKTDGMVDPKKLPVFPMNIEKLKESIGIALFSGLKPGQRPSPFKIGNVYNFLFLYCDFRYDLCMKMGESVQSDDEKRKYFQEASRSLSYYFCHNFMPSISTDTVLQKKLRDNFIDLSKKFKDVSTALSNLSLSYDEKAKHEKRIILNQNQQIELLDFTRHLSGTEKDPTEKDTYKIFIMEDLVRNYAALSWLTKDHRYLDPARRIHSNLPKDASNTNLLGKMIEKFSHDNEEDEDPLEFFGADFFQSDKGEILKTKIMSKHHHIRKQLENKNLSLSLDYIKKLELLICEHGDLQSNSPKGRNNSRELSLPLLKKIYTDYYILFDRYEFLYPRIVDHIICFMANGDIQGALLRFNAAEDLKFSDGQTLKTHQPHLKMILKNLGGEPKDLLEISERTSQSLDLTHDAEKSSESVDTGAKDEAPKLLPVLPFLIRHTDTVPFLSQRKMSDIGTYDELIAQLEKRRAFKPEKPLEVDQQDLKPVTPDISPAAPALEQIGPDKVKMVVEPQAFQTPEKHEASASVGKSRTQIEKEEKRVRHLDKKRRKEEEQKVSASASVSQERPIPSEKTVQDAPDLHDPRTISELYNLKGTARDIETEIENNRWIFDLSDFTIYLARLGCNERPNNGGHHILALPDSIIYEKDGQVVTILCKDLNIQGGSLTLPKWEKIVPFYLRSQILAAREKLRQMAIALGKEKESPQ